MLLVWRLTAVAGFAAFLVVVVACASSGSEGFIKGEVRFAREVGLPDGAIVTVLLLDTSLADIMAEELGRTVIKDASHLPVRFGLAFDRSRVSDQAEYSLHAAVRHGNDLLYINDTVHPVLTRGAPENSDVVVVSTNPFDTCVEPLPGEIHSSLVDEPLPAGAFLRVRLVNVTEPQKRVVVAETTRGNLGGFPIEFKLPHDGVQINRHHRYELEAEIAVGGEVLFHIPTAEWRRIWLPRCPDGDLRLINDVFPADQSLEE